MVLLMSSRKKYLAFLKKLLINILVIVSTKLDIAIKPMQPTKTSSLF